MATVPYSDGIAKVAPASEAPAVYQNLRPGPGFLAQGAALESAGQDLQRTAKNVMAISDYYDQVAVDDGLNKFQERARSLLYGDPNRQVPGPDGQMQQDGGYLSMRGQDAMRARADVVRQIDAYDKEISSNLKSPKAQAAYAKASRNYRNGLETKIGSHASAAATAWYTSVNSATAVNAMTDIAINYNDPEAVARYTEDLIGARVKNLQLAGNAGDPELLRQTIEGARADALVAQVKAMAVKEPAKALELLDANKATAGAQYDELSTAVRARAEQQIGLGVAQKVIDQVSTKATAAPPPAAPGQAPAAPSEKPDAARVAAAIHAQESGGAATAATSSAGAVGGWQIMPATFAKYAKPGEKIDNPADNAAVGQRIVADLYAKSGGDPARVAVGYFSGEGNIAAPGSATPWINDVKDATGKSVSSYVGDVMGRLGAPAPAQAQPDAAGGIAAMKADALQAIMDDKTLTPGAKSAALATVREHYQMLDDRRIEEKRAADERRSAYTSTLEIQVNRGQKSYVDVENAWQNGLISDAKRSELTLLLDRKNQEKEKVIEQISRADASFNGGPRMDPRIDSDRKAVDLHYQMTSASWGGLPQNEVLARAVSYAGQVGMAPTPLKTLIRGSLRSGNSAEAVMAAQTVSQLRNQNPQILNDFNEEDIRLASLIGTYSSYGVPAEKAYTDATEAMKVSEPERKARAGAYDMERGADIKQRDASDRRWLEGKLNSVWTSDPTLDPIMRAEWDSLVRLEYEKTANLDASRQYALDMVNRVWGRTGVGGGERYMKFAPEKFYGVPTMSPADNAEWMNEQLLEDVLKGSLVDPANPITKDRLFLTPDPTRTTKNGNPVYQVSIIGTDGVFRAVRGTDGRALPWTPDWEASAAKRREREKYEAHIEDLRRLRAGTTTEDLLNTMDLP